MEKKMDNNSRLVLALGSLLIVLLIVFIRVVDAVITEVMKFGNYDNSLIVWVFTLLLIIGWIVTIIKRKGTLGQAALALLLGVGQYLALSWVYYGKLYDYVLANYGFDPRIILFFQTLLLLPVVGVIWYGALSVFDVKPGAWKSYVIISILGPVIIAGTMWTEPYSFFEHLPKDKDGNPVFKTMGSYEVRSKFWILRDKENKVIDVKYSPGISSVYGEQLIEGKPKDVADVMKFLNKNSKLPIYDKKGKGELKQELDYITTSEKSFIVYCSDGEPSKYYRTSSNNLRILWKSSKNHFLLELRSGKSFTPEEIKKKKVYIGKEEFRIVPTKKDLLDVCIDVI